MMKKYNKPEIEALALETIDVIAVSAETSNTQQALEQAINTTSTYGTKEKVSEFLDTGWSW